MLFEEGDSVQVPNGIAMMLTIVALSFGVAIGTLLSLGLGLL